MRSDVDRMLECALSTHGIVTRGMLATVGISRHSARRHVEAGRLLPLGPHTLRVTAGPWCPHRSPIVAAVLDAGAGAWADGGGALLLAGLTGWRPTAIDVCTTAGRYLPRGPSSDAGCATALGDDGNLPALTVRYHRLREQPRLLGSAAPRAHPAAAAVRAASWARSDREAAFVLSATVQQRLARVDDMAAVLETLGRTPRRRRIAELLVDIRGGSESVGELDFVRECRRRRLPLPDRQVVRRHSRGHYRLDVLWEAAGLAVEVDGAHHFVGDQPTSDALRQNDLVVEGIRVMRIPRIALRVDPEPFFAQIERYLRAHGQQ